MDKTTSLTYKRFLYKHLSWFLGTLLLLLYSIDLNFTHNLRVFDYRFLDAMLRQQAKQYQPDVDILVIDIDDQSMTVMQELAGLWVWRREVHANLLQALAEFKPRAVLFDLNFHEIDKAHPKSDHFLSQEICDQPQIFLQTLQVNNREQRELNHRDVLRAFAIPATTHQNFYEQLQLPMAINPACWRLGLVNGLYDVDGMMRRSLLSLRIQGVDVPSLSRRVMESLNYDLPNAASFYLRWSNKAHQHISYGQLFKLLTEQRGQFDEAQLQQLKGVFQNKFIVLGSSATGAFDYHLTPVNHGYPGVDILALALDNLKNKNYLLPLPEYWGLLIALALIVAVNFSFQRAVSMSLIASGLLVASVLFLLVAYYLLLRNRILWVSAGLFIVWLNYAMVAGLAYLRERRSRDRAVTLFSRFLNPAVVKTIVDHGATIESLSGQQKQITVLFSDIRGFTQLAEERKAVDVVALLNRYYEKQVEIIWRHGGTLDKFIGDCIMAFWGAPVDDQDQVNRAIACALEMEQGLQEFKQQIALQYESLTNFDIGIGIHTGDAVVGFIGAARKLDYTAIGDTVNLASRVEGLTKGVARILLTSETRELADAQRYEFVAHGSFTVKGRTARVELFEPIRKTHAQHED